jgi:hypothetical protein
MLLLIQGNPGIRIRKKSIEKPCIDRLIIKANLGQFWENHKKK